MKSEEYKTSLDTFPKLLRDRGRNVGKSEVCMSAKDLGIWNEYTWKDYYDRVCDLCLGMVSLGLRRRDKVCILGENKPEWYWAELATQATGGIAVGVFTDCIATEVKYFIEHSNSTFVVVHDQEQVDKILEIKDELPYLKKVIYWDPKGMWSYRDPALLSMDQVMEEGRRLRKEKPGLIDELIDQGTSEDIGVMCYTSGTTGLPKGVMLSQRWLVEGVKAWSQVDEWYQKGCEYLSFIPPAWANEQVMGIGGSLVAGVRVYFPEEPETVQADIGEIGPELLFYGARLWESINRDIQARMIDSTFFRKWVYRRSLAIGLKVADLKMQKRRLRPWLRFLYSLAFLSVFRSLKERLGLTRAKWVYSVGAGLSPDIIRFFLAIGVELRLFYGCTETGVASLPRSGEVIPESSGRIAPWSEVKISEEGEILIKSQFMYSGYYNDPEGSAKMLKDGYFCTGDFGHINNEGHLIVIDRMEDLKPLSGGRRFSPQYIEIRLRFSPYIKDAVVAGGQERDFATAIVNIDLDNASRFAEVNRIPYTTFTDLSQKPQVIDLVANEIRRVNQTLPEFARVKRFVNLHKEFDADEGELTRTRKLRRTFVEDRYKGLIDALYSGNNSISVEAPVTYRDGSHRIIRLSIRISDLD